MKKLLSLGTGILLAGFIFAQSIPNGGVENWSNLVFNDLTGYQNSNDSYILKGLGLSGINSVRSTNAKYGNYALQLTTLKIGSDTMVGYVTNGLNSPLQGAGGVPYTQKPTGISFWYTCNVIAPDSALVMAVFKKSHNIIGIYAFRLSSTNNTPTYTHYISTFSPALLVNPDTVIFAAVSSSHVLYDNNNSTDCIPNSTITLDSVNFTGTGITQPVNMNGSFENWTSDTDFTPTSWNSLYPGTFQTTDVYAGTYAAQITTTIPSYNNGNAEPGYISTGSIQNFGHGGYPYTLTTDTFEFYYKYTPALSTTDSAIAFLTFKKSGNEIGIVSMELKAEATYTLTKMGFNLVSSTPDTVIVTFTSSKTNNPPNSYMGSTLKVDNVTFKSQPLSVINLAEESGLKIYPNPVTSSFNLNTEGYTGFVHGIEVYDMAGRIVLSASYASGLNNSVTSFNISKTSPGIYIVKVLTSTGVFYQKISKVE